MQHRERDPGPAGDASEIGAKLFRPGVAAEMVPQLFAPFTTTKPDGTGLGLAISRTIMEAHGGRLEYQPNEPTGAAFNVTLPIEW